MKPKQHLEYYNRLYPQAWKQVDLMRAGRGKELPFWPDWCFMPMAGAYAIVDAEASRQGISLLDPKAFALINDIGIICALAAWRVTQGVYRFDSDVYQAVINTPITGDLPHDVLFNLPEWCVYIETPGFILNGSSLAGFFAFLEYDVNQAGGHNELRLVLDYDVPPPSLYGVAIHLGPWTLAEALAKTAEQATEQAKLLDLTDYTPVVDKMQNDFAPLVSLLLYLCSVNSEIGNDGKRPVRPTTKKTKKGPRLFPPAQPKQWDVGVRMGAALRRATAATTETAAAQDYAPGPDKQRSSPRPHYRRAHWQGYWTGPKTEVQKYVVKWIQPLLIGANDDMPVTIRPVK